MESEQLQLLFINKLEPSSSFIYTLKDTCDADVLTMKELLNQIKAEKKINFMVKDCFDERIIVDKTVTECRSL